MWGLRKDQRQIVFYAEQGGYFPYLEGFIRETLAQSSLTVCYLTSDRTDPNLASAPGRLKAFYFKRMLPFVLLFLDAKVLVMTMPDLNLSTLRRSIRGTRHVYVFHSMVSTHMIYRFGGFDHYDVVFCAGPHQISELRRSEQLYQTAAKQLEEVGYPPLDRLLQVRSASSIPERPTALLAPSWGAGNILENCAPLLVQSLASSGFRVVVRPHPEWVRRYPRKLMRLRRRWSEDSAVEWDLGPLTDQTLLTADVLVTDWSGVALEYAFGTERPVLFMDVPRKVHNPRYEELALIPIEVRLRDRIGKVVPVETSAQAGGEARALLENPGGYRERILEERAQSVFHLGESAKIGAHLLLELCRTV